MIPKPLSSNFALLVSLTAITTNFFGQHHKQVFVNLELLARRHIAWELAKNLEQKGYRKFFDQISLSLYLTPIPITYTLPDETSLMHWQQNFQANLKTETEVLHQKLQHLIITTPPKETSPQETNQILRLKRWKAEVDLLEAQANERAKLRLKLAFKDKLNENERESLQQRLNQLNKQLDLLSSDSPVDFPKENLTNQRDRMDVTVLDGEILTDVSAVASLLAPPLTIATSREWNLTSKMSLPVRINLAKTLRQIATAASKAFVKAYAKQKGVTVTFTYDPTVPDLTEEFDQAWRYWLTTGSLRGSKIP